MPAPRLTVVIPVYNERKTLAEVVGHVLAAPGGPKELLIVDDGSTDGTREVLGRLPSRGGNELRVLLQDRNRGKGAAIRRGFAEARGEFVLVQDADLEYDPAEYGRLLGPLERGEADVVYGSRFLDGTNVVRPQYRWANWTLTAWSNLLTRKRLTDTWTCYKVFRRAVLDSLDLREDRFGIEAELTAKVVRGGWRIVEVPASYRPRTHEEGKKIGVADALRGFWVTLRHNLAVPRRDRVPVLAPPTTPKSP